VPGNWSPVPSNGGTAVDQLATRPTTATALPYTPTVPGNWSPAPTTTLGGLDQLAARTTPTATTLSYTPAVPANWKPVPSTVADALDQLVVSHASAQANAATVGPTLAITFTSTAITPIGSGVFMVWGTVSADASGASTQVIDLLADGAVIATGKAGTGGAGPFNGSLIALAPLAPGSTHTFAIRATASGGTNTANAGWMKVMVLELGG